VREETLISLPVPDGALWGIFGFTIALFITVSAVIGHHWHYYGMKDSERQFSAALYYTVSGALLVTMAFAALAYGAF
jgi:hypothetical protein